MTSNDPNSIDLDDLSASGIGNAPRPADISARAMLLSAYRHSRDNFAHAHFGVTSRAGELLVEQKSLDAALSAARTIVRFLEEVARQESPGAAASGTVPATIGDVHRSSRDASVPDASPTACPSCGYPTCSLSCAGRTNRK